MEKGTSWLFIRSNVVCLLFLLFGCLFSSLLLFLTVKSVVRIGNILLICRIRSEEYFFLYLISYICVLRTYNEPNYFQSFPFLRSCVHRLRIGMDGWMNRCKAIFTHNTHIALYCVVRYMHTHWFGFGLVWIGLAFRTPSYSLLTLIVLCCCYFFGIRHIHSHSSVFGMVIVDGFYVFFESSYTYSCVYMSLVHMLFRVCSVQVFTVMLFDKERLVYVWTFSMCNVWLTLWSSQ